MTERAVAFGAHSALIGVVCEPTAPAGVRRAVLMANIGMHHRVGPSRLYVELARALATSGLYVLRFDLSGMGDSAPRRDGTSSNDSALRDLDSAMTFMTSNCGIAEFVLVGLCSGVDGVHAAAACDARVRGAVFIDGYSYPTTGFLARHAILRPLQPGRWMRYARRLVRGQARRNTAARDATVFAREEPSRAQFAVDLLAMTARRARLLFIYTGGATSRFNAPRQLAEMLGRASLPAGVDCVLLPHADHVFSRTDQRRLLCERITGWCAALPAEAPAG